MSTTIPGWMIRRGWHLWELTPLLGARSIRTYKRFLNRRTLDVGQARIYETQGS